MDIRATVGGLDWLESAKEWARKEFGSTLILHEFELSSTIPLTARRGLATGHAAQSL